MDQISYLENFFYYPDKHSKSREYAQLRQHVTVKYGVVLACFMVIFLAALPLQNYLRAKGYWFFNKIHILRTINKALERVSPPETRQNSPRASLTGRLCDLASKCAHSIYLNSSPLVQILLWSSVFSTLTLIEINGGDLIFVGKRLGRLCAQSLPTVFFLTMRPSPLPHTLYLSLLPIHKWLSRAVILLAALHTIIYLGYFLVNSTWDKVYKKENLFGWAAMFGFIMIIWTSLLRVRDRSYKLFFFNHYFWSWVIVLSIPFHVRPINTSIANMLNVMLLIYQACRRISMTRVSSELDIKVNDVSPNLACIDIPNTLIHTRAVNPGAHVRITNYHPNPIVRLGKQLIPNYHPYTLVSLPLDRYQRLVVRKSSFLWRNRGRYLIYGSFDPKLLLIRSRNTPDANFSISKLSVNARKILIVIGGSAISFAIPLVRVANYHGIPVKVVWVIRDFRDIAVLRFFEGMIHGDDFEIFVTGNTSIRDGFDSSQLRNASSYGTFPHSVRVTSSDLEANEFTLLDEEENIGNQESENVDVDFTNEAENDIEEECPQETQHVVPHIHAGIDETDALLGVNDERGISYFPGEETHSITSRRTSKSHSINDQFVPQLDGEDECHKNYLQTIKKLHLDCHIYKGRPLLNYRYYNWCVNESDIFTQCSGPVMDESHNLLCCKDLPGRQHVMEGDKKLPDLGKVWVISAGPKSLVKKTKLWANENGLKYHEEAFYV
ncbi:hypothetical protein METBIDRAFT_79194 [Metschnikowia bicuspidata var. bicuspidata NRRL YB-4993]|uniref:Ferric oxidoreductase domain-containing protein n=1 Tax=Metschnikowia bicuspidata var. bicuspidata NRRL YB-4993 TaxID=869754 RepID=A0A1A0H740_9ASCO|nr:hypothetical protein METBIDRAFT_79194 [Metschnikowia bicuspidata var. bicuspidata NRRL YB-4993]OBA19851.1 hypothetical protein METBIDRAFT_79194 [Metschnikowia bicuspidata var. bicuspidata NRRL YB-4993]